MTERVTMSDVAARAGVSTKTVSNVLRGVDGASSATRARVLDAVAALGYELNTSASALRSGHRGAITLAVPTLLQPLVADFAEALMRAAGRTPVILELTRGETEQESAVLSGTWLRRSGAAVFMPRALDPASIEVPDGLPLVLLADDGPRGVSRVTCPPQGQTRLVAAHLREQGCTGAAVIGTQEPADRWTEACATGLRAAGLAVPEELVVRVAEPDGVRGGVEAVSRLLRSGHRLEAVVCHNDALAAGAMGTLLRRGLRVPQDVVVVGRGDTDAAAFAVPTLTSVSTGAYHRARAVVELLEPLLAGRPGGSPRVVSVGATLTTRRSSLRLA